MGCSRLNFSLCHFFESLAMRRILIIEDEIDHRSSLQNTLEEHNYHVDVASSINEAIENYALPSFNLIITDLRLPGQPGTEV